MGTTLFFILAAILVVSAFAVVFNRNVVHSALALLVNFCTLAIVYFILNAQFLAIVQILVYAGAIVVLFLFVVMLLGAELGETKRIGMDWKAYTSIEQTKRIIFFSGRNYQMRFFKHAYMMFGSLNIVTSIVTAINSVSGP